MLSNVLSPVTCLSLSGGMSHRFTTSLKSDPAPSTHEHAWHFPENARRILHQCSPPLQAPPPVAAFPRTTSPRKSAAPAQPAPASNTSDQPRRCEKGCQ